MMHPARFFDQILKDPEDDLPRLRYADWLDECCDPLGEFIRVQCRLAQLPANDVSVLELETRERALLAEFESDWTGDLKDMVDWWTFRRGFVEEIGTSTNRFFANACSLFHLAPIQEVHLSRVKDQLVVPLVDLAFLQHTFSLNLSIRDEGACLLAHSPLLAHVHELNLSSSCIGDVGLKALAASPHLFELRELDLAANHISSSGVRALANSPLARQLQVLHLSACKNVTQEAVLGLAQAYRGGSLAKLTKLSLKGSGVDLPEELVGRQDAREIFRYLLARGKRRLVEAKVMLIGTGRVGKSHLLERLFPLTAEGDSHYDPNKQSTHDIDMRRWPGGNGRPALRAWDFGGQEHLHGSHRFFLGADHAVYLLVLDATQDAHANRLHYWLRFAAHHGRAPRVAEDGQAERTPVVIVLNKCDALALANSIAGKTWRAGQDLLENHHRLLEGIELAQDDNWHMANVLGEPICGLGIFNDKWYQDELLKSFPGNPEALLKEIGPRHQAALREVEARLLKAFELVPGSAIEYEPGFHQLKDWLEKELAPDNSGGDLVDMLRTTGGAWGTATAELGLDGVWQEWWLATLRSLGVIHWVGDFDRVPLDHPGIEHTLFNPEWVKKPIYNLIQTPQGQNERGKLTAKQFAQRLAGLNPDQNRAVRELALACRVAYSIIDARTGQTSGEILVPDLLETRWSGPDGWSGEILRQHIGLPFLSDRCLFRFIAAHYNEVDDPQVNCWRNKIVLTKSWPGCAVMVQSEVDPPGGVWPRLSVTIRGGSADGRKIVMDAVRRELEQTIRAEGLLDDTQKLKIENDFETRDDHPPRDEIAELSAFVATKKSAKWIEEKDALDVHNKKSRRRCNEESFATYRRRGTRTANAPHQEGACGATVQGYVWKYEKGHYRYLEESFALPYKPNKP